MTLPVVLPPGRSAVPPAGGPPSTLPANPVGQVRWRAMRQAADDTYRFFLTNQLFGNVPPLQVVPPGLYDVTVVAPVGDYVNHELIQVQLPRPRTPPPPPAIRSDFLVQRMLWPTRRAQIPPGQTAVVGRIVSQGGVTSVADLRVVLFELPGVPPPAPYTRTNANGDFVFRFPTLVRAPGGAATATLGFEVRNAANAVAPVLNPVNLVVVLGRVTSVDLTVP